MPIWKLLANEAAKYAAKGWSKRKVAEKLLTLKKFSNNQTSIFKFRKDQKQYKFATTFDDAWNSIKGKKVTKEEATATAKKGRHTSKTEAEKAAINKKLREARLKNIAEGKGLNLPPPKEGGSTRLYVPQLDSYINPYTKSRGIHEVMEQALRRDKQRGLLDIAFGKGTSTQKEKRQKKFLKQFQKNLRDDEFMKDYLKKAAPFEKKADRYFKEDFSELSTNKQYVEVVRNYLKSRGHSDEEIDFLFRTRFATTGHIPPVRESYADWLGFGNKASLEAFEQSADPKMWNPELGLVNMMKGTSDPWIFQGMQNKKLSAEGLKEARRMYDAFGIQSMIRGKPIGKGFDLEKQAKLVDWATATPYETKVLTGRPGTGDVNKVRNMFKRMLERGDITYEEIFAAIHKGKYPGFQAGGLVNIGSKLLAKLAEKLSEKEMKMLMGSLWKGVDPKRSPRYKAWAKKRWGPGYKWPYEKSKIKGPEIKKSHMADLTEGERVELQTKHADKLWEYQMKKKLGRPMGEDLEYPFLNPENEAFIVTEPRTGLGRYQLQHYVDPENVGPVEKYKVYDWWDEIMNRMRKKPKFKYVKDAKGNIILKEVK